MVVQMMQKKKENPNRTCLEWAEALDKAEYKKQGVIPISELEKIIAEVDKDSKDYYNHPISYSVAINKLKTILKREGHKGICIGHKGNKARGDSVGVFNKHCGF